MEKAELCGGRRRAIILSMAGATILKRKELGIIKLQRECTRPDYFQFYLQILEKKITQLKEKASVVKEDLAGLLDWELIDVPLPGGDLRCPCTGSHLEWIRGLAHHFNVIFQRPEKVGYNTYEFRFSVTSV